MPVRYDLLGYVYFIQADLVNLIKIGHAENVVMRLCDLQVGSPVILRPLGMIRGTMALEKKLHKEYAEHRTHGEWFEPVPGLLDFIRDNALPWPVDYGWPEIRGDYALGKIVEGSFVKLDYAIRCPLCRRIIGRHEVRYCYESREMPAFEACGKCAFIDGKLQRTRSFD